MADRIPNPEERDRVLHDPARLAALRASGLLDSASEESFNRLTRLAARLTGAPVSFISLVDENRDFYKACFGFPEPLASERQLTGTTFCHFTLSSNQPLVIDNTRDHPVYSKVPTVESLGVAAYIGIPLVLSTGEILGSFCAIDFKPHHWTELDVEVLQELAASTLREIELRGAIHAERTAQEKLAADRRLLEATMEQMPIGVVVSDASGGIILNNAVALEILGRDLPRIEAERAGRSYHLDGTPYNFPEETPINRALRNGEIIRGEELLFERDDGKRMFLSVNASPVRSPEGEIIAAVVGMHDVTAQHQMLNENKRLYDEARLANQAKDDFFAAISHELRTPMTAILGWSRLLKMEQLQNALAAEAAEAIESSAALQAQLVDDLLDVSRITAGKVSVVREPLQINDVVDEVVQASQPVAASKGVKLQLRTQQVPLIHGDRSRIRQVLGNLLSNAMKFTPAGGLIEISSEQRNGDVRVSVRDTGRGISRDLLASIFERGRQSRDGEQGGLGLGLFIARHLVSLHEGVLRAESDGAGKGATFTVSLPIPRQESGTQLIFNAE